ncbi:MULTISPECIES: ATP-binding cassette domain-containing protein [Ferrimonas]|uniref:ATP-binding cassette domain-containing protein n=1 Tax=Ferrimonas TaxID=44011 RepID=UPI000404E4D0|nr:MULTISPECIES: ATP-binding cassette domain-containing protein [Ferrimonas]USD36023.1 ATP-binding cassette domain-containing protein [Ferrimonas sp. SCSIO 43195]
MTAPLRLTQASLQRDGVAILRNVSLTIDAGETVALVGASGAGKSSLLELLRQQHCDQVAWCPQAPALVPMLSLYLNVYMGQLHQQSLWRNLKNLMFPSARHWQQVHDLARELGLLGQDHARTQRQRMLQSAERFSGGEQQRISIARALFQQRPVFLGDEPVSALDEVQSRRVIERIKSHHRTSVLALHDVELALACCDRIVGLQDGQVVLDRASAELDSATLLALYPEHPHG